MWDMRHAALQPLSADEALGVWNTQFGGIITVMARRLSRPKCQREFTPELDIGGLPADSNRMYGHRCHKKIIANHTTSWKNGSTR